MKPLTITDTDEILIDYVLLPIQDLHQKFLFKIQTPIELCWLSGSASLWKIMDNKTSLVSEIKREAMQQFNKMLTDAGEDEGLVAPMDKWGSISKITLRECHIVPKE